MNSLYFEGALGIIGVGLGGSTEEVSAAPRLLPACSKPAGEVIDPEAFALAAWGERKAKKHGDDEDEDEDKTTEVERDWFCAACSLRNTALVRECGACGGANPFWAARVARLAREADGELKRRAALRDARLTRESFLSQASDDLDDLYEEAPKAAASAVEDAASSSEGNDSNSLKKKRRKGSVAVPAPRRRSRPCSAVLGSRLPGDLVARVAGFIAACPPSEKIGLRAVSWGSLAIAESDDFWQQATTEAPPPTAPPSGGNLAYCRVVVVNREAASTARWPVGASRYLCLRLERRSRAREGLWQCVAGGWRWLERAASRDVHEAALATAASCSVGADLDRVMEAADHLSSEAREALRRDSDSTLFETSFAEEFQTAWKKAVRATLRRDADLLAESISSLAYDTAERLARSSHGGGVDGFCDAFDSFERWARCVERGCEELDSAIEASRHRIDLPAAQQLHLAPSLRRRCLAAFRAAALYGGGAGATLSSLQRALSAYTSSLFLELPGGGISSMTATMIMTPAELSTDANLNWSTTRLAHTLSQLPLSSQEAVTFRPFRRLLAVLDQLDQADVPGCAPLRNDQRARLILPLRAIDRFLNLASNAAATTNGSSSIHPPASS